MSIIYSMLVLQQSYLFLVPNYEHHRYLGYIFCLFQLCHTLAIQRFCCGIGCPKRSWILTWMIFDAAFKISFSASSAITFASLGLRKRNDQTFWSMTIYRHYFEENHQTWITTSLPRNTETQLQLSFSSNTFGVTASTAVFYEYFSLL